MSIEVSISQIKDPKCDKNTLKEIIENSNGKWDPKVEYALMNPNCPIECIEKVVDNALKHPNKNNYDLAICALHNPNCPINVLEKVIGRDKKDMLTGWAKKNPRWKSNFS